MNTPNKLTVARMIMVPFFVLFILTGWGGEANRYICLVIFAAASITDWFDGNWHVRIIWSPTLVNLWIPLRTSCLFVRL